MNIPADDPLAVAVVSSIQGGDVERLRQLLGENPGLVTARIVGADGASRTLLHVATDWPGHFPRGAATVATLVAAGADVNASVEHTDPNRAPETPLHWAASSDDVAVLDALVLGGADIEAPGAVFTGGSPLSDAVIFAQWRAALRLLHHGAQTTIWQAAALGLVERVESCVANDAPSQRDITNALWHACRGGQRSTAECLLERGADINWIGHDHKTPLDAAQSSGVKALVDWLSSRGGRSAEEHE